MGVSENVRIKERSIYTSFPKTSEFSSSSLLILIIATDYMIAICPTVLNKEKQFLSINLVLHKDATTMGSVVGLSMFLYRKASHCAMLFSV